MTTKLTACALILASGILGTTPALAQGISSPVKLTRAQVQAELVEAIRTGDMPSGRERTDLKLNELYPSRYPMKSAQTSLTREQVAAELGSANRNNSADGAIFRNRSR